MAPCDYIPKLWSKTNQPDEELHNENSIALPVHFQLQAYIHDAGIDIVWAFLSRNFSQFYSTIVICKTNKKTFETRMVKFVCKLLDTHSSVYAVKVVYLSEH